jgi:radical SAM protein with 4Fe4S-binding SPASM domain
VEITRSCFLDCIHCSSLAGEEANEELTLKEIKQILNDFVSLGGETLEISGGEPLRHKDIWRIIQYSKKKGLKTVLFTCGILSKRSNTKQVNDKVAEKIKRLNVDKIVVSLHGSVSETHDGITQREGSFIETINFIRSLVRHGNIVGIHFVPMNLNFEELDGIVQLAKKLKVKEVSILRFVPQGRGKLNEKWLKLSPVQSAMLIKNIITLKKETNILRVGSHLDFHFIFDNSYLPLPCTAGVSKCLIQPNGDVIPCAVFKGLNNYVAGNIHTSLLSDIWRNSPIFDLFRQFDFSTLKGYCARCDYLKICKGRCPAQRVYAYNDFSQGPDPYCPLIVFKRNSLESEISEEHKSPLIKKIVILGSCRFEREINEFVNQLKEKYIFLAIPKTLENHNTEEGYLYAKKIFEPALKRCDEVWVWNQDGYLGEHTLRDIQLASFLKKKIRFLFPP